MRNSLEEFSNRFEQAEARISELDYRSVEIIHSKEQKEKIIRMNRAFRPVGHNKVPQFLAV